MNPSQEFSNTCQLKTPTFNSETLMELEFPDGYYFAQFRKAITELDKNVKIKRTAVYPDGRNVCKVSGASKEFISEFAKNYLPEGLHTQLENS